MAIVADGIVAFICNRTMKSAERGYDAIASADPALEARLNAGVEVRPDADAPRLARGSYTIDH